jgi:hypothetical protein
MELGWALPRRKQLIEDLSAVPQERKYPQKFQGRIMQFDVLRVPLGLPKYRLANGRTLAAQEEYLSKNKDLPDDFFERDLESEEAHLIQHDLLKKQLKSTNADLIEFFKVNEQEEPIILTQNGFVVNGNRRLCAMREVHELNRELYARFKYIDVIVLPPCDEKDIEDLEAQLQVKKDIKADYSWITFACMLRRKQSKYGTGFEELEETYSMKQSELQERLDELAHVDSYLSSREKPKEYENVLKARYAFEQLRKIRSKISNDVEKDIFTSITYCVVDSPPTGKGRLYDIIPDVHQFLPKIIERLKVELNIDDASRDDGLSDLFGDLESDSSLENLALTVSNPDSQEQVIEVLKDVIDEERAREKDKKNKNFVLSQTQKANTLLSDAINCFENTSNTIGLREQLEGIEESVSILRGLMQDNA